jgi:hypothetical protein
MVIGKMMPALPELLQRFRDWQDDPHHADDLAEVSWTLDQFAQEFAEVGDLCEQMAAWCRLGAGLVRGEDVPESIHRTDGEDPADTARWEKWRMP